MKLSRSRQVVLSKILTLIGQVESPYRAMLNAGDAKMRPVCTVVLTTVPGIVLLLNDSLFGAMAVYNMIGLSFAAVLSLVVTPVLYAIMFGVHEESHQVEAQ